ncbi:MAG: 23S rRNA (pseudouridine(1915)-N(3))-methyltransferase RlmH [Bdellovibrio sp.]|nr:23S rRNA (pseudouridine(1915)-N(3))-methyltransferase RlmH [Bdellovibrio sp.]
MKWTLYDFKSATEPWFDQAEQTYFKKINHYAKFEITHLKTNKSDRNQASLKIKFEEDGLLQKITNDDFVILFDEKGQKHDSISFSKLITKAQDSGKKRGVFIIGGAFGVSDVIKKSASVTVTLSDMVMNHLVAETVVLEQVYRAFTIINRIPYHNI